MQIGFVGLGRMGANMVRRLLQGGHQVVAYNRSPGPVREVAAHGASGATSLQDLVQQLPSPRTIWLMLPAGGVTDEYLDQLMELCQPGDTFVDGANSRWKDTKTRAARITARGFNFLDCGVSGGVWGLQNGYAIMAGGPLETYAKLEPIIKTLAPADGGYGLMGGHGAGHFVKMVHNGIEYGMMQAYAEGFQIMEKSEYDLDLAAISELWMHGSVVRSWLLELAVLAFNEDPRLEKLKGYVQDSGEGRWTLEAAIDEDVPAPVIALSLISRFYSRDGDSFSWRVLAALRNQFGGHAVKAVEPAAAGTDGKGS